MKIAQAETADAEAACRLDAQVIGNDSRSLYLRQAIAQRACVVARMQDRLAGFAVWDRTFFGHSFIQLVIVDPVYRRQGVATGLIREIMGRVQADKLFTSTNESNAAMRNVCESLGFVRSGIIENLDEGDPEWIYFRPAAGRT
ncbi:GNAT family N-acetyltransferase [Cohnella nanjingensis]|uniref:GNAT family N-acetyltransferase n=1 Tax=Cohnella nanjingensis TaxID=1387779 RepID=A0A7X0RQ36_9BACL|nr:GNAT family N-acetyltransferase [Cohnella nanjingensis]MBB6671567.1 GNAT family N-acetyltransferase [Cohnella nanjingensis]